MAAVAHLSMSGPSLGRTETARWFAVDRRGASPPKTRSGRTSDSFSAKVLEFSTESRGAAFTCLQRASQRRRLSVSWMETMPKPILPNSPLSEVSFELRFPGDLSLYSQWGAIQKDLHPAYPKLLVPPAIPGVAPLLQPLQLASAEGESVVMLAINSIAVSTKRYKDFDTFVSWFRTIYGVFRKHCAVAGFTRFGLRYVNILPPEFPGSPVNGQLHPCLRLRLEGWGGLPAAPDEQPALIYQGKRDSLTLRLTLASGNVPGDSAIAGVAGGTMLDMDCFEAGQFTRGGAERHPMSNERVEPFLTSAHDLIEEAFLGVITPEYERYLKGESQ